MGHNFFQTFARKLKIRDRIKLDPYISDSYIQVHEIIGPVFILVRIINYIYYSLLNRVIKDFTRIYGCLKYGSHKVKTVYTASIIWAPYFE